MAETAKAFVLDMWLARQTPEKVLPILHKVIEGVKDEFADAIANGGGIYAVGYCFGAKYVLLLAGDSLDTASRGRASRDEEQSVTVAGPIIKAGAVAHGSSSRSQTRDLSLIGLIGTLVTTEDIGKVRSPVLMVCVGKSSTGASHSMFAKQAQRMISFSPTISASEDIGI